jgi:hypothetical protein
MPAGLAALAAFPGFGFTVPTVPSSKLVQMDKLDYVRAAPTDMQLFGRSLIRLRRDKFNG